MMDNQPIIDVCEMLVKKNYARSLAEIARKCGKTSQYFTDLKKGKAIYSTGFLDLLKKNIQ